MNPWRRRRARNQKLIAIIDQADRQSTLHYQAEAMVAELDALVGDLQMRIQEIS